MRTLCIHARVSAIIRQIIVVIILSGFSNKTEAIAEIGSWSLAKLDKKIGDHWHIVESFHFRVKNNLSALDQILLKSYIGYKTSQNIEFGLGYGWTPQFNPHQNENRIWAQFSVYPSILPDEFSLRTRLEERFFQGEGNSTRLRQRAELKLELSEDQRIFWVISEEVFFNLNSLPSGPQAGLDQNRFLLGLEFGILESSILLFGLLTQYSTGRTNPISEIFYSSIEIKL